MRVDALAVRLRPRTPLEAADLGVALCRGAVRSAYTGLAFVALPVVLLALASREIAAWLPSIVIWWAKPWLDCTVLFILSRAAFGQPTSVADIWRAQREIWWRRLLFSLTVQRLSPWRLITQPVYQLEGLSVWKARPRVRQVRRRRTAAAAMVCATFSLAETSLWLGMMSLAFWFAPPDWWPELGPLLAGELPGALSLMAPLAYGATVLFVEPFFVAAGFAMYLDRRAELEAWDIEQEFRRAFAA